MNSKKQPINPKEISKGDTEKQTNRTNSKMADLNTVISLITLHLNRLNTPIKKQRQPGAVAHAYNLSTFGGQGGQIS